LLSFTTSVKQLVELVGFHVPPDTV